MVDKSDPSRKVFEEVAKWNNTIESLPEWEEVLEFEYIRQKGEINMLGFHTVQRWAYDRGLYNAVTWMQRCKDAGISYTQLYSQAVDYHEKEHGPRGTWITKEIKAKFSKQELDIKEEDLERQLRELRSKRQNDE